MTSGIRICTFQMRHCLYSLLIAVFYSFRFRIDKSQVPEVPRPANSRYILHLPIHPQLTRLLLGASLQPLSCLFGSYAVMFPHTCLIQLLRRLICAELPLHCHAMTSKQPPLIYAELHYVRLQPDQLRVSIPLPRPRLAQLN